MARRHCTPGSNQQARQQAPQPAVLLAALRCAHLAPAGPAGRGARWRRPLAPLAAAALALVSVFVVLVVATARLALQPADALLLALLPLLQLPLPVQRHIISSARLSVSRAAVAGSTTKTDWGQPSPAEVDFMQMSPRV